MDSYTLYLLVNNSNHYTYVGITNNPENRLRKHNGELVGGAKYTNMKKGDGEWQYYGFILNLEKNESLSIEKKIHIHTKKTYGKSPLDKRLKCINNVLKDYPHLSFIIL
jgi:predicted GIY-YIG superfamily endonuclease